MDAVTIASLPVWLQMLFGILVLISMPFKGMALWKSAQLSHKKWFIVLFLVNTFGILDIYYIYSVARKYSVEVTESK